MCISLPYTEDGGGSHIVRVLVTAEADDMGSDTLSDVLIYTVQLCGPGNLLILQQIDTYHTSIYNYIRSTINIHMKKCNTCIVELIDFVLNTVHVTQLLWVY